MERGGPDRAVGATEGADGGKQGARTVPGLQELPAWLQRRFALAAAAAPGVPGGYFRRVPAARFEALSGFVLMISFEVGTKRWCEANGQIPPSHWAAGEG